MEVITSPAEIRRRIEAGNGACGFVPTMGALHEGHLSLIRRARQETDLVTVSIFVNPAQFGPAEDFSRYPRSFEGDCRLAEEAGAELIFAPEADQIYPPDCRTHLRVEGMSETLCGAWRPGHFDGVVDVVARLFLIVAPDRAYFGEKDFQQLQIIRRMVRDLHFPVEIVACPTVREPDGLAMSSRNRYLTPEERERATCLYRGLCRAAELAAAGETSAAVLEQAARRVMEETAGVEVQYVSLVEPEMLGSLAELENEGALLAALVLGSTRLIDNIRLQRGDHGG